MLKSLKWKMTIPILVLVLLIIAVFARFLYGSMIATMKEQGYALTDSIALGLEGAMKAREVSEEILEKEMIAESVLLSYAAGKGATHEELKQIAERGGMDELWTTDSEGNTSITSIAPEIDFNFGSDPDGQAYEYMKLLTGEEDVIVQPAQIRTVDDLFYKFAGVGSWDPESPQIIQVARNGQMLLDLEQSIGAEFFIEQIREQLGNTILYAALVDSQGQTIISTSDEKAEAAGFTQAQFAAGQTNEAVPSAYDKTQTMNYSKALSDGTFLAVAVSNDVLSGIKSATVLAVIIASLVTGAVVLAIVSLQVSRINTVRRSLAALSAGDADLTKRIDFHSNDEIGALVGSFNKMLSNFHDIIADLKEQAVSVRRSTLAIQDAMQQSIEVTELVASESQKIKEDSETQHHNTADSSKAMEDIAKGVQHIMDSVVEIGSNASGAERDVQTGRNAIADLQKQLEIVTSTTGDSIKKMNELVALSNQISEFTLLITAISEQTNLLALNASIEAARAGENGKGFAVVAEEVRDLAEQSKQSAAKISEVASRVLQETENTAKAIHHTANEVETGTKLADEANDSFGNIITQIHHIVEQAENVSGATEEMAAGSEEAAASFHEIASVSEHAANRAVSMTGYAEDQTDNMKHIAHSVDTLLHVSEKLTESTDQYQV